MSEIGARLEDTDVVVTIANDGPTLPATIREGYGLRNIRSRLLAFYGVRGSLAFGPQLTGGAVATASFPVLDSGSRPMTLRALVVDDEPVARRRLKTLLESEKARSDRRV